MESAELRRLIVRHRHVAPMLSVLLAGTDARVRITDTEGGVILDRQAGGRDPAAPVERHPIVVEGATIGWVEGPRPSGSVAAVLSYACAREADKRALAREALDRYRELNLIYDLAEEIGATLEVDAVARVAVDEASRLPTGGQGFIALVGGEGAERLTGGILAAVLDGEAEVVNDVASDPRASAAERGIASLVVAPLRARGERIGVLGTASTEPREYHASDLKVLTAIAALTAPTLQQAAVHEAALRDA
jgi:GAF domain-containing protein